MDAPRHEAASKLREFFVTAVDPTKQAFRLITVENEGYQDWFDPHAARVYRFSLP